MKNLWRRIRGRKPGTPAERLQAILPQHEGKRFEVDNFALSSFLLERVVPIIGIHPYPLNELLLLTAAVCVIQPRYIFEWGTHIGKSARLFHEVTRYFGLESEIHSIDLPETVEHVEHPHKNRGIMVRGLDRVVLHEGDGLDSAVGLIPKLKDMTSALFYVDGDHRFESVQRELEGICKAFPAASIVVHDTFMQTEESKYNIGPRRAVDWFVAGHGAYELLETTTGLPGMTLLYSPRQRKLQ